MVLGEVWDASSHGGLAERHYLILDAILSRLIPTDHSGPGAREANVIRYVEGALASAYVESQTAYREGLEAVDVYAQATFGGEFVGLASDKQDALLVDLELGRASGFRPSSGAFFELLRAHAIEGMFGDPSWGGNENCVGWDLLNYPGPRFEWSEEDQQLDAVVTPVRGDAKRPVTWVGEPKEDA